MIENLETLVTLSKTGTMMETSTRLKISQSAVSKRIAALERYYDRALIERNGRRVVLTHHGTRLVEKVTPLISELRSVFLENNALRKGKIIIGVSEAILASWGPKLFAEVRKRLPEVEFTFHAQRSPVVLDRIRSGEYMVGICTGSPDADTDLQSETIRLEPMVIIPSALEPLSYQVGERLDVITIESRSGAWRSIEDDMRRLKLNRQVSLESFFSVAQMALAGFGHGLVPVGVAQTLGVPQDNLIALDSSGLHRPVRFVARKSMFSQQLVRSFYEEVSLLATA
ncbi:MAG: LysR family transcriptional regulator [Pseudomonadales bacterium]|jgi:DNA-binding transcriptional LysR family regulator|nr:LysR family transcriptional regulator [Pseudomonadales bacterium]MDP6471608.1 LysR family transcriptional regulator [Pseudomonadales bacterium]|tara:strand:- start:2850 stop:3701 length:852 start_codon:yes stop_codon:yes gene_type:complete